MKRCLKTLGVTFIFLVITSVVGYAASFIPLGFWEIFGIASGILIASVLLSVLLRKSAGIKIAAMLLNAISMGFYLRSWYINRGFDNPLWLMLCVALLASVYLLIFILPLYVDALNRHYGWYLLIFTILSIAGYVCLVIFTKTTWVSTLGYFGLLVLGFIMTMSMDGSTKPKLLTSWQIASFTVAVCAVIILIIVAGGDGLDAIDVGGADGGASFSSPRKTNDKKQPPLPPLDNDSL